MSKKKQDNNTEVKQRGKMRFNYLRDMLFPGLDAKIRFEKLEENDLALLDREYDGTWVIVLNPDNNELEKLERLDHTLLHMMGYISLRAKEKSLLIIAFEGFFTHNCASSIISLIDYEYEGKIALDELKKALPWVRLDVHCEECGFELMEYVSEPFAKIVASTADEGHYCVEDCPERGRIVSLGYPECSDHQKLFEKVKKFNQYNGE